MLKIITAIAFFICNLLTAQTQFEQGMGRASELWKERKITEASAMYERIKWTGVDAKPLCVQVDKAVELFATFKPETPFSPKWGLERALEAQKNCK